MTEDKPTSDSETPRKVVKDLTESSHDESENDPVFSKTRKMVMRVGTAFFGLAALFMFLPMIIGVAQGISKKRIWDPYTNQSIHMEGGRIRCVEEAQRLMLEAGRRTTLTRHWAEPYRDWSTNCKNSHKALYELLDRTRLKLRKNTVFVPKPKGN